MSSLAFLMRSSLLLKFSALVPNSGSGASGASLGSPVSLIWARWAPGRSLSAIAREATAATTTPMSRAVIRKERDGIECSPDRVADVVGRELHLARSVDEAEKTVKQSERREGRPRKEIRIMA